jgi:hypothetical protein
VENSGSPQSVRARRLQNNCSTVFETTRDIVFVAHQYVTIIGFFELFFSVTFIFHDSGFKLPAGCDIKVFKIEAIGIS